MASPISDDAREVGQTGSTKDYVDKYDAQHGKYDDTVNKVSVEERLPTVSMPKAPDPSPFSIGPMAPGGR